MRYYKVDREKFYAVLKANGIKGTEISEACGYSRNWVSSSLGRYGGVGQPIVTYLEHAYGVTYEEYKYMAPPKQDSPLTVAQFKALVREAVREAMEEIERERRADGK